MTTEQIEHAAKEYRLGATLQSLGTKHGGSRQRVHQLMGQRGLNSTNAGRIVRQHANDLVKRMYPTT